MKRGLLVLVLSLACNIALPAGPGKLTIATAADLKFAMGKLVAEFERQHPGVKAEVINGSSGKFYEQILHGAPFDLFFSADIQFPRMLAAKGLTTSNARPYARGRIVLWSAVQDASKLDLTSLRSPGIKKIAIANPRHAPYGQRAQEALERAGVWAEVKDKIVLGENVAQAAQFAETGAADAGIIALALAQSPNLKDKGGYYLIPEELHGPLDQGYVILKRAEKNPLAQGFAEFVGSEPARVIFRSYGFVLHGESVIVR
jgi:molybdate transport system substrate-binding protein